MRLLCGIVALTVICMIAVAAVTDHLAEVSLASNAAAPSSRVHLISGVTQALKHAEECRRGYLATGDESYFTAYRTASADVDFNMDRLVSEDQTVTSKLAHAEGLRDFVHEKLADIGKTLEFTPQAKTPAGTDSDLVRLEKLMDSLAREESADMTGELAAAQVRTDFHRNLLFAVVVINVLFLAGAGLCAAQIGKIYSLVTICAWSKRVNYEGKWVPLEEFMWKRFGTRITHGISQEEYEKWGFSEGKEGEQGGAVEGKGGDSGNSEGATPKAAA